MKLLKTKTARFAQVVEKAGKPEVYTLWQKPAQDRHLQSEIKNNRIMTVLQTEPGSEFGWLDSNSKKALAIWFFQKD